MRPLLSVRCSVIRAFLAKFSIKDAKWMQTSFYETEYASGAIDDAPGGQVGTGAVLPRMGSVAVLARF